MPRKCNYDFLLLNVTHTYDFIGNKVSVGDTVIVVQPRKKKLVEAKVLKITLRGIIVKHTYWRKSVVYKAKKKTFTLWRGRGFFLKKVVEEGGR